MRLMDLSDLWYVSRSIDHFLISFLILTMVTEVGIIGHQLMAFE